LIADATQARQLLGWEPSYDFERGMRKYIDWYRNYGLEERIKID
jgi:nucleoside-diphosphate-sugar epimerase